MRREKARNLRENETLEVDGSRSTSIFLHRAVEHHADVCAYVVQRLSLVIEGYVPRRTGQRYELNGSWRRFFSSGTCQRIQFRLPFTDSPVVVPRR